VLVVPRRMAARAAAARMADQHGGRVGERFGYSVRHDSRVGPHTAVECVTPGILLRRLQNDPSLQGVSTVIVDEFHERSVDQDLLLALLLDVRGALREDLQLLVMSATLEAGAVADLLGGVPVVSVASPLYPIRTIYRPGSAHDRLDARVAEVTHEALGAAHGDVLVFLPGRAEIRSVARVLDSRVAGGVEICELHGSVPPQRIDEILSPAPAEGSRPRRVILATSVAETSITVPGVRVVVDSGRRRFSEVDPRTGLPGLVTRAVSAAGAEQRRGRCGREAPGTCYRMWAERDDETRRSADPPEIEVTDLSPLLLQVLDWGGLPGELGWMDPPPSSSLEHATSLLEELGALRLRRGTAGSGPDAQLTPLGRRLASLGFHPRIGAIAALGEQRGEPALAAEVAAVLEADGGDHLEVAEAVRSLRAGGAPDALRRSLEQWRRQLGANSPRTSRRAPREDGGDTTPGHGEPRSDEAFDRLVGRLVLAGFADRLARRRDGRPDTYHLRGGGEVQVRSGTDLGEWIVAVSVDARAGSGRPGAAHLVASIHPDDVAALLRRADAEGAVAEDRRVTWDPPALIGTVARTISEGGARVLPGFPATLGLRSRVAFASATGIECPSGTGTWPDLSDSTLAGDPGWLAEALVSHAMARGTGGAGMCSSLMADAEMLGEVLRSRLGFEELRLLDRDVPTHWQAPGGRPLRLEYGAVDGAPASVLLSCRLQDLLGVDTHPTLGRQRIAVVVELLSPAGRPIQRTTDLPGFWRGSYSQVRGEMRGRYPKHRWPEKPWEDRGRA
jgi:ATP-dependent helicase HrpB